MKKLSRLTAIIAVLAIQFTEPLSAQIYVATNGDDGNSGSINSPLATLIGARNKSRSTGVKTIWIRGGRYPVTSTCKLTAQDSDLKIMGYQDEEVIFDGAKYVNPNSFSLVTNTTLLSRMHTEANGHVYSQVITDPSLIARLTLVTTQMSMDDKPMIIARFPNYGFAHILDNTVSGETVGAIGNETTAKGAQFKIRESFSAAKWNAELNRKKRALVKGYYAADWFKDKSPIFSVSTSGVIKLMNGSRAGISVRGTSPNRLFAMQLLCELNDPGEWYFDPVDNRLYVWPYTPITSNTKIGAWVGPELITVTGANNVKIQKLTIQNLGTGLAREGAVTLRSSTNCEIAGLTIRSIGEPLSPANIIDGDNCGMLSCDFYDHEIGIRCYGGTVTSTSIVHGNNYVKNCHFTQVFTRDLYGKAAAVNGAGNKFINNLVHNRNGQPITHEGVDHLFELNEVFNVGIEEGDGGAFYTGANIWSHGNILRHNFVHHIMSVPKMLGRASMFSDDVDGGDIMEQNVVYKGGNEALKMNGGAGHTVQKNVVLDCYTGIRQGDDINGNRYGTAMDYITNNNATSNVKSNYIGRMLKAIGTPGWESGLTVQNWSNRIESFWTNRYPYLQTVINKYNSFDRLNAYECRFYDNMFYSNTNNIIGGPTVSVRGSQSVNLGQFVDPNNMNFKFKEPRPSFAPNIPFQNIGLFQDEFRCAVPDKNTYRRNVKNHFASLPSHSNVAYDFTNINARIYYNSGKMVMGLTSCTNIDLDETSNVTEFKYDLGTGDSKVFSGYTRMTSVSKEGVYNWINPVGLNVSDRGYLNGANDINRDFLFSQSTKTLVHKVDNGLWNVIITWGDAKDPHDRMRVMAEGQTMDSGINTNAGQFKNSNFNITVTDGKLNLDFIDDGGPIDNRWVVTRIWLRKQSAPPAITEYKYDLGTASSAVFGGYTRISNQTTGAIGWTNTSGLSSRDRGSASGVNDINRDFVFSSSPRTFENPVTNGTWQVTITFGDRNFAHDNMIVKAEGITKLTNISTSASQFSNGIFTTNVSDGKLSLEFSDGGGSDANWVVTRIWLQYVSGTRIGQDDSSIVVFPNPSSDGNVTIAGFSDVSALDILNISGLPAKYEAATDGNSMTVSGLVPGLYIIVAGEDRLKLMMK